MAIFKVILIIKCRQSEGYSGRRIKILYMFLTIFVYLIKQDQAPKAYLQKMFRIKNYIQQVPIYSLVVHDSEANEK